MVTVGGEWVVNLLDCLVMKYPSPLLSEHFGSVIPTLCFIVIYSCFCFFCGFFNMYINASTICKLTCAL